MARQLRDYCIGIILLLGVAVWAIWLLNHRKNVADYISEEVRTVAPLPLCTWVPVDSPELATLGFSKSGGVAWTFQKSAMLAFRSGARKPWYVDLGVVAVVGNGVVVSADGGRLHPLEKVATLPGGKVVRLPLALDAHGGVHLVTIKIAQPLRPKAQEQRWLGLAINRIRACDSLQHPNGWQPDG